MEWEFARNKAIQWMNHRKWKFKLAKKKGFEQSLFEHTLIQLDVLISLFPFLRSRETFRLTDEEVKVLWLATLAHDVGKETDSWQLYIHGNGPAVSHCIPDLAKKAVFELIGEYAWSESLFSEAISGILLHMNESRTPTTVLSQTIASHTLKRWKMLAEITDAIDNLASANGLFDALSTLERSILSPYLKTTYHQVSLRGISTTLLHRAASDTFIEKGWLPLIHYTNGTIYVAGVNEKLVKPDRDTILRRLVQEVRRAMGSDFFQRVVGSPIASMVPKPDLFNYPEMRQYLHVAAGRVSTKNFRKKKTEDRQKTLDRYLLALCQREEGRCQTLRQCQNNRKCSRIEGLLTNLDLDYQSDRLSRAHPEMVIFKFFKTVFSNKVIDYQKFILPASVMDDITKKFEISKKDEKAIERQEKEIIKAQKAIFESLMETVKNAYEQRFGIRSFELLQKTTTLTPDRDMAYAVDIFWSLLCSRFISGGDDTPVEFFPDDQRVELLIDTLVDIADEGFASLDEVNRPKRVEAEKIAESFVKDLIYPAEQIHCKQLVDEQLEAYKGSKPVARKAGGLHLCPVCNRSFTGGTNAKADFLNNPESHTNRAPSHGSPGYIVICDTCKFERFLQQQILEGKVAQMMVLMPRMNIGYHSGEVFRNKALQIWEQVSVIMSEANPDPQKKVSLSLSGEIARKLLIKDTEFVIPDTPAELVQVFTYRASEDKVKEYRRELKRLLNETVGEGLDEWNEDFDTDFTSEEDFLLAVENLSIPDSSGTLKEIRGKAYKLTMQMRFVCETPHFILVPIRNPIAVEKDSEVNAAIRELFSMLVIGITLDCAVAMIRDGEEFSFTGGEGIVRVPPVAALRNLVGCEWLGLESAQKWVKAIAAAALVTYAADYPERSNLYQVLSSLTPGHILRRMEMKSDSGYVSPVYFSHLEIIKEVLV
ncbi:MAG: hypothetical protein C4554_03915 [Dethiobacter sp.]|nr:MAG: hypothetical protein C4554_03915 [Dethiobacter sp.]